MPSLIIILIVIALISFAFVFTGMFRNVINTLFRLGFDYHRKLRRDQRPTRIFLVRHGQSQANIDPTLYARVADDEIELTEQGQQQATAAGQKLRSIIGKESMYVYMSPYCRSRQTWGNIKKSFSPSQIIRERQDPRLRELEFGHMDDLDKFSKAIEEQKRTKKFFYRFAGGESGADVYDRASLFLDTLFREMDNGHHDPTDNIVVVSHGFFIRIFLMRYFRWNAEDLRKLPSMENCEICQLTKVNGVYTLNGESVPETQAS